MRTIFSEHDRAALLARLDTLRTDSPRRWGAMSPAQAVAHLAESLRMALGDLECTPSLGPLSLTPVKQLVIYWLPWPTGVETAPELRNPAHGDIDGERDRVRALLDAVARHDPGGQWPSHPAFGRLTGRTWGVLMHRHIDHHLRQFGA